MKKKILIFHPLIAPYRLDLFNKLYKDFDTTICLTQQSWSGDMFYGLERQFLFSPVYLDDKNILKRIYQINKLLKTISPDVVIVSECGIYSYVAVLYCILFNHKCKRVSFIDDSYDMISGNHHFTKRHKWSERIILPLLNEVICVEPRVADYFKKQYGVGYFFPIIRDEILLRNQWPSIKKYSSRFICDFGLANKTVFIYVGRLVSIKNVIFLIQAFKVANLKNAKLIIVGDGVEKENLEREAEKNENIVFTGRIEGLPLYAWYDIGDVFILPSTLEPFGAVTNEALIMGCQSLISKLAGSSCLIEEGINGSVFDPYDQDACVALLKKYNEKSLRDECGKKPCLMTRTFDSYYSDLCNKVLLS